MKQLLLSFSSVLFILYAGLCGAQQNNVFTPQQYEQLKLSGNLPAGNHVITYGTPDTTLVPAQNRGSASCGCYIDPDGSYTLAMAPNDDGSTAAIPLPFTFCLYGDNYTSVYINNNGNISFGSPYGTFSASAFPSANYVMVAPFWGDVDTRPANGGEVWYKITPTALYVNWVDVGYYSMHVDKLNTFQVIITDGSDPSIGVGNNVAFCYKDMQWTTGDASSGVGGFGGVPATVGANRGNNIDFVQFGRFDQAGLAYDGPFGANDGVSWLDYATFKFSACVSGNNIAPIVSAVEPSSASGSGSGIACGDTLNICGINDTLILSASFIAPENGQNITITASAPTLTNFSIIGTTPAPNASITMMIVSDPADAGFNLITIDATDDGSPPMTTTLPISIFVDTSGISALNPVITGPDYICPNGSATLNVNSGYDSYLWSDGSSGLSINTTDTGSYWVTVELNGCFASTEHILEAVPGSVPVITGDSSICGIQQAELTTTTPFVTYSWSNSSTNDTIYVGIGTYTVTTTDTNGCVGTSQPFTVTTTILNPIITGDDWICAGNQSVLSTTSPFATYSWSSGGTGSSESVGSGSYTVTVTDSVGCTGTSSAFLVSVSDPDPVIVGNQFVCIGDVTILNTTTTFSGYLWSNGTTSDTTIAGVGTTYVVVTDTLGCTDTAYFDVYSYPEPIADFSFFPPSGTIFAEDTVYFTDSSTITGANIVDWLWLFGDNSSDNNQNPLHYYNSPGTYMVALVVTTDDGCVDTIIIAYDVIPQMIIVPNVFTPTTSPGYNDYLVFTNLQYFPNSKLTVFNRWGTIVYESDNYQNNWDGKNYKNGKQVSDGTYYYFLQVNNDDQTVYKGPVTIFNN